MVQTKSIEPINLVVTDEMKKEEALKRMKILELHENVIYEFETEDKLNLSESGFLFWLDKEEQKLIKEFETKNNALVYHLIKSFTNIGLMLSLLYVGNDIDEWEMDKDDLINNYVFCYVINCDDDNCSEFGSIMIKKSFGGIIRTA